MSILEGALNFFSIFGPLSSGMVRPQDFVTGANSFRPASTHLPRHKGKTENEFNRNEVPEQRYPAVEFVDVEQFSNPLKKAGADSHGCPCWGESKVHSFLGVITFLQHAPKTSPASKM